MFYTISFSAGTIRRRRRRLLLVQGAISGVLLLVLAALIFSYRPANATVYALCREYAEVYRRILPRELVMSSTIPVGSKFFWTGEGENQAFQNIFDSLTKDLQMLSSSKAGTITFSSSTNELVLTGDLLLGDFPRVQEVFADVASDTNEVCTHTGLTGAMRSDPLVVSYLEKKQTLLQKNAEAQKKFLNEEMKGFAKLLWRDCEVRAKNVDALKKKNPDYFLIDPSSTLRWLGSDTSGEFQKRLKEWKSYAGKRFSFRKKMCEALASRVDELKVLDMELPQQAAVNPAQPQVLWLMNTATNFLTARALGDDRVVFRIEEVSGWAGFYKTPGISVEPPTKQDELFMRQNFLIKFPDNTRVSFRQFADFYRCLANEPERFQLTEISDLVVELTAGAVFVNSFSLAGFVVGIDPKGRDAFTEEVESIDQCLAEWKGVHSLFQTSERKGNFK